MSLRKRLRVIVAAFTQRWHEKWCAECGATWWQQGKDNELMRPCPDCDAKEFDEYLTTLERDWNKWKDERKGAI